jgi:hypothetical protein
MIPGSEDEELFFTCIPVSPNAGESGSPIIESMRQHPDLCFGIGDDFALKEGVSG